MRLSLYTIITALIILLAKFRKLMGSQWDFRLQRDSPFVRAKNLDIRNYNKDGKPYIQNRLECCDCGLTHGLYIDDRGFLRTIPWRPGKYNYKFRSGR